MRIAWFARWYPRWKRWKDNLIAQVKASALWQAAGRAKARAAEQWASFKRRNGLDQRP
jgi:hypothetical protein